jgi:hypothetical protein
MTLEQTASQTNGCHVMAIHLHHRRHHHRSGSHAPNMIGIKQIPAELRTFALAQGHFGASSRNAADRSSLAAKDAVASGDALDECRCIVATDSNGHLYNEEAFQFLLALERERYARSRRPFALALVRHGAGSDPATAIESSVGTRVLTGLAQTLRDTDVVGWYREGRVVGVILTHLGDAPLTDVYRQLTERTVETLRSYLPAEIAQRLNVRLYGPLEFPEP